MKKILETLLALAILGAIMAGSGETPNGGIDLPWTLTFFGIIVILSFCLRWLSKGRKTSKRNAR